ncbi:unnamed protein product [Closterium sp. NIES-54]
MDSAKTAPAVISNGNPSADHHPAAPAASTSSSAGKPARLFRQPSRVTERMANCLLENRNEIVDTLSRCLQCGNGILLPHQLIDQLRAASAARRRPHATPPRTAASPRSPTAIVTAGGAAGALIPADAEIAKVLEGTVEAVRRVGSADLEAWRRAEGRRKSGAGAGEAEATGAASADRVDRVDGDEEGEGEESLEDSPFGKLLLASQEAVVVSPWVALAVRVRPGEWQHVKINAEEVLVQAMTVPEYLAFKELLVSSNGGPTSDNPYYVLELDFGPFNASFPRLTQPRSIGHGVHFLNRYLSSRIFTSQQGSIKPLVDFLRLHSYRGQVRVCVYGEGGWQAGRRRRIFASQQGSSQPLVDFLRLHSYRGQDVAKELQVELGGRPGLIIGNYSDGNLVATLLSHQMGVTQTLRTYNTGCSILLPPPLSLPIPLPLPSPTPLLTTPSRRSRSIRADSRGGHDGRAAESPPSSPSLFPPSHHPQPALFEAFGLTVVEAMTCGLPTFATCHGGPREVIHDGESGFHIDPYHGDLAAERMADFFERCRDEPKHWDDVSAAALARIQSRYTWGIYAERLMTLSRVYGFWKFVSNLERREMKRYIEMFYILKFRQLVKTVPIAEKEERE